MASRDDVLNLMQQRLIEQGGVGTTKKDLEQAFNLVLGAVRDVTMQSGESLRTPIGTFRCKEVAARVARNPRTGEPVDVPAKRVLAFKAASSAQDAGEQEEVAVPATKKPAAPVKKAGVKPALKVKK